MRIKQAIDELGYEAVKSIVKEIMQLNDRDTFTGVYISKLTQEEKVSIISSSMFLKIKQTPQGLFDKLKARLLAGGHLQDREATTTDQVQLFQLTPFLL